MLSIRRTTVLATVAALALATATACGDKGPDQQLGEQVVEYPTRTIQIMAPAAPGGGWDSTARSLQAAIEESGLTSQSVEAYNVPGAGGTLGLAQLANQEKGNAHHLMVTGLVMIGAVITNRSAVTLADVTPIATLTAEAEVIVVPADSPYQTLADAVKAWKADPARFQWGGGSAGGTDQILVGLLAKAAGIDPKLAQYVPYSGGGEARAALLSGDLAVAVSSISEFADLIEAGQLRALGVSSSKPYDIAGTPIPTLKDGGYDVELMNWRGIVAPPGISDAEKQAITKFIDAVHSSAEWQKILTDRNWEDFYKSGAEAASFFASENERITGVLNEIGLAG